MSLTIDKAHVEERIADWACRLESLYARVRTYYDRLPDPQVSQWLEGSVLQTAEPIMDQSGVSPRMLPTVAVLHGLNRVSFVPVALWVVGANGRIRIGTSTHHYVLVDLGGQGGLPSEWRIVTSRLHQVHRDFDEEVFHELVLHQALSQ